MLSRSNPLRAIPSARAGPTCTAGIRGSFGSAGGTTIPTVANKDRLTGLDTSFLHLELDSAHMHVGGCSVFTGSAPTCPAP